MNIEKRVCQTFYIESGAVYGDRIRPDTEIADDWIGARRLHNVAVTLGNNFDLWPHWRPATVWEEWKTVADAIEAVEAALRKKAKAA